MALHSDLAVEIMDEIQLMHDTVASTRYDPVVIHSRLEELDHILLLLFKVNAVPNLLNNNN